MRLHTDEEMIKILEGIWENDPTIHILKECWTSISNKEVDVDNIFHRYLDSESFEYTQAETEKNRDVDKKEQIEWHTGELKLKICYDITLFSGIGDIADCDPFDML